LKPGERLPPERELAATFGINRLTLRSALGQLQAARLLSVRHGRGYLVRDFREQAGPELFPTLALAGAKGEARRRMIADLLFVRRLLARGVLDRLVAAAAEDRAVVVALTAAVERFATSVARARTAAERMTADLAFTRALRRAGGDAARHPRARRPLRARAGPVRAGNPADGPAHPAPAAPAPRPAPVLPGPLSRRPRRGLRPRALASLLDRAPAGDALQ